MNSTPRRLATRSPRQHERTVFGRKQQQQQQQASERARAAVDEPRCRERLKNDSAATRVLHGGALMDAVLIKLRCRNKTTARAVPARAFFRDYSADKDPADSEILSPPAKHY